MSFLSMTIAFRVWGPEGLCSQFQSCVLPPVPGWARVRSSLGPLIEVIFSTVVSLPQGAQQAREGAAVGSCRTLGGILSSMFPVLSLSPLGGYHPSYSG